MARKQAGSSRPVIKYIFKYMLNEQKTKGTSRVHEAHTPKQKSTDALRKEYMDALQRSGVSFTKKDIDYLITEHFEPRGSMALADVASSKGRGKDKERPFILTHNLKGNSIDSWVKQFEENERGRVHKRSDQTNIHHIVLSFGDKDREKISNEILEDLTRKFFELRGIDLIYAATKHEDTSHSHIHIAASATRLNGMSSRISKKELEDIKIQLQEYQQQKYGFLTNSLPEHGRAKREMANERYQDIKRNERFSIKNTLLGYLDTLKTANVDSMLMQLQGYGFSPYYRLGRIQGVCHSGSNMKFRFSKLGIDLDALKVRDEQRANMEQEMRELEDIRAGDKGIERDIPDTPEQEVEDTELGEIEDIRDGREDEYERDIADDTSRGTESGREEEKGDEDTDDYE